MSDLKAENQKLVDLCRAVHDIDLDALWDHAKIKPLVQLSFNPTQWITERETVRLIGIMIRAAIKFRKAIKNIPLIPKK